MNPTAPATTSQQALGNLQAFQGQMKAPQDILSGQEQQLGVPGMQGQVSGLRQAITNTTNLLNQVAPSVYGRTGNSLVTSAQAGQQIANEQAPIATQLGQREQEYTGVQSDLDRALQEAAQEAGLQVQGQQTQLSNMQDIYKNLYGQEQDALARQLEEQKLAETKREANLSAGGGITLGGGGDNAALPGAEQRSDKGFNFYDTAGHGVNAFQYSQGHNIPFRTLLQQMASKGDTGATAALQFIGKDGNADPTKVTTQWQANLYHALTGRYVGVYGPNPTVPALNSTKISNPILR